MHEGDGAREFAVPLTKCRRFPTTTVRRFIGNPDLALLVRHSSRALQEVILLKWNVE